MNKLLSIPKNVNIRQVSGKSLAFFLIIKDMHRRLWRPLGVRSLVPSMNTSSQAPPLMKTQGQRFQVIKSILLFGPFL